MRRTKERQLQLFRDRRHPDLSRILAAQRAEDLAAYRRTQPAWKHLLAEEAYRAYDEAEELAQALRKGTRNASSECNE